LDCNKSLIGVLLDYNWIINKVILDYNWSIIVFSKKNIIILLYKIKNDILVLTFYYYLMMPTIFNTNYLDETPDDVKKIIYRYTIPKPPPPPPKTEKYDLDIRNFRFMDYLVDYYPTSYVMKKRYNNIINLFQKYRDDYIMNLKEVPYSKKYEFNKMVYDFCEDHSTEDFRKKYKIEKRNGIRKRERYINRKGKYY